MSRTMDSDTIKVEESMRFLVEATDSNGSASVFECDFPAREIADVLAASAGAPPNLAAPSSTRPEQSPISVDPTAAAPR